LWETNPGLRDHKGHYDFRAFYGFSGNNPRGFWRVLACLGAGGEVATADAIFAEESKDAHD
jgi:hypothetical protein